MWAVTSSVVNTMPWLYRGTCHMKMWCQLYGLDDVGLNRQGSCTAGHRCHRGTSHHYADLSYAPLGLQNLHTCAENKFKNKISIAVSIKKYK